jgi:glycosyltransferase involved in cell wall biosynthesis
MSSSKPLVSIIMPMKNAAPWLVQCIESIIDQQFTEWQLIVVNDHSSDNSFELASSFRDKRISVLQSSGAGIIDALQLAFSKSAADHITRMDADDIMPPHKLATLYAIASENEKIIATGLVQYFGAEPISEGYLGYEKWLNTRAKHEDHWQWIYRECVIASANWMTHRSNVSFDHAVYPEDYDLVFDWYEKGLNVKATNSVTHLWREHQSRTSRNSDHYQQKAFFSLKLKRFVHLDFDAKKSIILLGNNQKVDLTLKVLAEFGIVPTVLTERNLGSHDTEKASQILIGVWPNSAQRLELERFLNQKKAFLGENFWYL